MDGTFRLHTELMRERLGGMCPKILRVYSEMHESLDFPIPRDDQRGKISSRFAKNWDREALKSVSLHHVIRNPTNPSHLEIKKFDALFMRHRKRPDKVTDEQIKKYKDLVRKACQMELQAAEVILCTCSVSASRRITDSCTVRQCIVDECGMCMEPEVLIPLAPHRPRQIVLIGDHKQLQPIVKNDMARCLGLDVSLFERYHQDAIMLTDQYRMVGVNINMAWQIDTYDVFI